MFDATKWKTQIYVKIKNKKQLVWVTFRMVEILGNSVEKDPRNPPETVYIRMLNPQEFYNTATKATSITKSIMRQRPERIFAALSVQIRQAQVEGKSFTLPEADLIKRTGLQKTFDSDPSKARKRLRAWLDGLKKENVVQDYTMENRVITFFPSKPQEKTL